MDLADAKPSLLGKMLGKLRPGSSGEPFSQVTTAQEALGEQVRIDSARPRGENGSGSSYISQAWTFIQSARRNPDGNQGNERSAVVLEDKMVFDSKNPEEPEKDENGEYTGNMLPYEMDDRSVLSKFFGIELPFEDE